MQEQFSKSMQQMHKLLEPSRKLNQLMLDHAEKIAHLNIEAARKYNQLALEQIRNAMSIRDPESLQEYLNSQGKIMQTVSSKISEDATALADLNKNMGEEVQKIAQENVTAITDNVQEQHKPASKTAEKPKNSGASRSGSSSSAAAANSGSSSSSTSSSSTSSTSNSKKSA